MRVAVAGIPEEGRTVRIDLEQGWARQAASVALEHPVQELRGELRLQRRDAVVRVQGELVVGATAPCSRCTEEVSLRLVLPVDLLYAPPPELEQEEHELSAEELDIGFYEGDHLELAAVISEAVALEAPQPITCVERSACDARTRALLKAHGSQLRGHPAFAALRELSN